MTYDYTYDAIMRSFEDSLQRLGLGKIDILLVHDIGVQTHGAEVNAKHWKDLAGSGYRALSELKSQGLVSAIGLGVNEVAVLMDAFEIGDWDIHLLANRYTLLEQTPLNTLYAECQKRGTSMMAAGPFAGGILAGTNIWGPPTGAYQKSPPEVMAKVDALQAVCKTHNVPLGAAALQFALAHPVIASVLTGPKSPEELKGILDWWNTPIPDGLLGSAGRPEAGRAGHAAAQRTHCVSRVPKVLMVDVDGVLVNGRPRTAAISSPTSRPTLALSLERCRRSSSRRIGTRSSPAASR